MDVPLDLMPVVEKEADLRFRMLCILYLRLRSQPSSGMMTMLEIQTDMGVEGDALLFATWYLRNKKLVAVNDRSLCAITTEGIDFVEDQLRSAKGKPAS